MRCPDGGRDGNDGGRGDGNPPISTFADDRTDVVRGSSPGDGEYAEVWEFVRIREFGRIRGGIAVSRLTSEQALALERWCERCGCIIGGQQLADMFGFQERHAMDRAMQAFQCMPLGG
jgi:hypothetical protein